MSDVFDPLRGFLMIEASLDDDACSTRPNQRSRSADDCVVGVVVGGGVEVVVVANDDEDMAATLLCRDELGLGVGVLPGVATEGNVSARCRVVSSSSANPSSYKSIPDTVRFDMRNATLRLIELLVDERNRTVASLSVESIELIEPPRPNDREDVRSMSSCSSARSKSC